MRSVFLFSILIGTFAFGAVAQAQTQTSPNYQNLGSTFAPAVFDATSPNYQINGSVEMMVGNAQSPAYQAQSGIVLLDSTSAPSDDGDSGQTGGGGGAGGLTQGTPPADPVFTYRTPTFLSHQILRGQRDSQWTNLLVNGSEQGVVFPSNTTWERDLPLFLGVNGVVVQARSSSGVLSRSIGGEIKRLLIGDVNGNKTVDDADLSLFTRAWKKFDFFADFNEDSKIDDADLSLLVSHWGVTQP